MKFKLFFVFFFISFVLFSQQHYIDSLFYASVKRSIYRYKTIPNLYTASFYFNQKKWDSTLIFSMRQLYKPNNDKDVVAYSHFFRGYSFYKKKLLKESQKEFLQVPPSFEYYNTVRMRLGAIALEQKEFKKAISYFDTLSKVPQEQSRLIKKSEVFNNLGLCYYHQKEYQKAEPYFIKSIQIQEEEMDTIKLVGAYGNIASFYYDQYKDELAIPYFTKAYQFAHKTESYDLKRKTAKNMAVVEENRKDFQKALTYRKESQRWKDSLNDQNKIWEVAQLEKEFAIKQKQKEVSLLQTENRLKEAERNMFLYSTVGLLLLFGTGVYFYREKIKNNKIIAKQKETLDQLNATKDKLFSIVSHDLRSSVNALKTSNANLQENLENKKLENLKSLLQNNSAIVNGAYGLLDNLLHWALLQTKQSYFEITRLRLFFIIEQVAYNYKPLLLDKNLKFENSIDKKEMIYADQESLKIIFRNLLDNAIKFSKSGGRINIYTQCSDQFFCDLVIEDTGVGMTKKKRLQLLEDTILLHKKEHEEVLGTGLGLQLCKSMIKKNMGKFSIDSKLGKGTRMIVSLPKTTTHGSY